MGYATSTNSSIIQKYETKEKLIQHIYSYFSDVTVACLFWIYTFKKILSVRSIRWPQIQHTSKRMYAVNIRYM